MTAFLFFLKLVTGLLSGVVAIVAIFRSKAIEEIDIPSPIIGAPTRKQKRITTEGKVSAILAIVLICVSLLAQTIEQAMNNAKSLEAQRATAAQLKRTDEEIGLTRTAIDQIEHVVTRFQDCSVFTCVEIDASSFDLDNVVPQPIKAEALDTNLVASFVPHRDAEGHLEFSGPSVGVFFGTNGSAFVATFEETLTGVNVAIDISLETLESHRMKSSKADSLSKGVVSFLKSPITTLTIWRSDSDLSGDADFTATSEGLNYFKLEYLYPCNRIRASWESHAPQSRWKNNARVTSLSDIGGAHAVVKLDNFPEKTTVVTNVVNQIFKPGIYPSSGSDMFTYRLMPPPNSNSGGLYPPIPIALHSLGFSTNGGRSVVKAFSAPVEPVAVTLIFNSVPVTGALNKWREQEACSIGAVLPNKETFIGSAHGGD